MYESGAHEHTLHTNFLYLEKINCFACLRVDRHTLCCCISETAVTWEEKLAAVDDKLWSVLSTAATVKVLLFKLAGIPL